MITYYTKHYSESLVHEDSDFRLNSIMGVYCHSFFLSHINDQRCFYFHQLLHHAWPSSLCSVVVTQGRGQSRKLRLMVEDSERLTVLIDHRASVAFGSTAPVFPINIKLPSEDHATQAQAMQDLLEKIGFDRPRRELGQSLYESSVSRSILTSIKMWYPFRTGPKIRHMIFSDYE